MSIRTDAKTIGSNDAKSFETAAALSKLWHKSRPEVKQEIAVDFKIGYIAGREKVSLADAERIVAEGKTSKANTAMIDRAYSAYRYYIVQGKTKPTTPVKSMRVQAHLREAATSFLAEFEGETLADQITQAIKVLQAMR